MAAPTATQPREPGPAAQRLRGLRLDRCRHVRRTGARRAARQRRVRAQARRSTRRPHPARGSARLASSGASNPGSPRSCSSGPPPSVTTCGRSSPTGHQLAQPARLRASRPAQNSAAAQATRVVTEPRDIAAENLRKPSGATGCCPQWRCIETAKQAFGGLGWAGAARPVPCRMMIRSQPVDSNQSPFSRMAANTEADDLSASHGKTDAIGMRADSAIWLYVAR